MAPGQWLPKTEGALAAWADWCASQSGACAEVSVSAHWQLVAVADDAMAAWQHYYGLSADELAQDWVVRSVKVGDTQLCCAVPRTLVEALKATAQQHHVQLQWVGPWWIRDLEQHVADQIQQGDSVQPWVTTEPGLRIHASLAWDESASPKVQLRQVWCESSELEAA